MLKMNVRKFLRSLNFRIMVFLILIGIIPALLVAGGFLAAYDRLSITQLGNDVRNQCQILATQLSSASYFENMDNQTLEGEMTQLATLYDGRIIIIDQDLKIVEDTYELEDGKTIIAESVIRCFRGETVDYRHGGRFIELTVPITTGGEEDQTIIGVILVTASTDTQTANLETLRQSMETWLAAIGICILALAILLSSWLVKPLRHMNQSIGGLVEGALADDLDIHDCTETEKISDTFNLMLAKLRRIEESRQEFVSNVSHELKTPLASMKVLADSLLVQEGAPVELYQEFMKDIAEEIDMHVSTISRGIKGKYLQCPRGTIRMKSLFLSGVSAGTDLSETPDAVKEKIKEIIDNENPEKPYSDQEISELLEAQEVSISRRTVAKYRKELGISTTYERKYSR